MPKFVLPNMIPSVAGLLLYPALIILLSTGCSMPRSSLVQLSIAAQIIKPDGSDATKEQVQVQLPAQYGLNEIDLEYGSPESYGNYLQTAWLTTDALGTINHTFQPIIYSRALWLLPPLGFFPSSPPPALFFLRLASKPDELIAVLVKDNEVVYGFFYDDQSGRYTPLQKRLADIEGSLITEERGDYTSSISTIKIKLLNLNRR